MVLYVPYTTAKAFDRLDEGDDIELRTGNQRGAFASDAAHRLDGGVQGKIDLAVEVSQFVGVLATGFQFGFQPFAHRPCKDAEQ